jgi:hypothetical protein
MKAPKWLKAAGRALKPVAKWAGTILLKAAKEKAEDEIQKRTAPGARPKTPKP